MNVWELLTLFLPPPAVPDNGLLVAGRWYHYRGRVLRRDGVGTLARQPGYYLEPLPPVAYAIMASLERQTGTRCGPRRNSVFGPKS